MKIPKHESFRIRIIVVFSVLSLLLVLTMAVAGYRFIKNVYLEEITSQATRKAEYFASVTDSGFVALLGLGAPSPAMEHHFVELSRRFTPGGDAEFSIVTNSMETVVHSSKRGGYGLRDAALLLYRAESSALRTGEGFASTPFRGADGKWYLWGMHRLHPDYLLVVRESAARFEKIDGFALVFLFIGIGGAVITFLSALALARSLTRPIEKLIGFSNQIGGGNLSCPPPEGIHGELGILAETMDTMRCKLAENQKEREKLLAQIAHEIRNPLGGIELLANLVHEDLPRKTKTREYIERILKEISGLKSLITSFLQFSKPKDIQPAWVEAETLFDEIAANFAVSGKNGEGIFEKSVVERQVYFDRDSLKQILLNLVQNSIQASGDSPRIELISASEGKHWKISVRDNGTGLIDGELPALYDTFYTTKAEGTGLGLAICKKLAELNGAAIEARNNAGAGCTFSIVKERTTREA